MYHYNAFISYNHNPRDIRIAAKLQSQLENYRIPAGISSSRGLKKIERVFLDKGELEVAGDLNKVICDALENTDYLIVICSPESRESVWVKREIEYFLRNHTIDDILTVITAGEPFDVLPEVLFHNGLDEEESELLREPLSCDYRLPPRIAKNVELPRLVAALVGCRYDDLVQRQRHYRNRRIAIAMSLATAVLLGAVSYLLWSNKQIRTSLDNTLREQSRNLALQSKQVLRAGDRISAMQYAIDALPSEGNDRPVVPEAILSLSQAMNLYETSSMSMVNATRIYPSKGSRHVRLTSISVNNRTLAAELFTSGRFVLWDLSAGKELMADYSAGLLEDGTKVLNLGFSENGDLVLITGKSVIVLDPSQEKESRTISLDGEYFRISDYNEYKIRCDEPVIRSNALWLPVAEVVSPETNSDLKIRHNSLALIDEMADFARDSYDGDELAINIRREAVSDIKYRIVRIDLESGKQTAEASAPRRPVKMGISPDGDCIACCYSDYYDLNGTGVKDSIEVLNADDLTVNGRIESDFISDFAFDKTGRILICGFDKKPENKGTSDRGRIEYLSSGQRYFYSFSDDRNVVMSCYDQASMEELWSVKETVNVSGTPWLTVTPENTMLSNACICTTGNTMLITDSDGKEIGCLSGTSAISVAACYDSFLMTILDDGRMTNWTYGKDHKFSSVTEHNVLMGPIVECLETGSGLLVLSTDTTTSAYKEVLTQYQDNGMDSKWEPYQYAGVTTLTDGMKLIDADYYDNNFVEIYSTQYQDRSDDEDKTTAIIVRDVSTGRIRKEYSIVTSDRCKVSSEKTPYTDFLYSGTDRARGKVYFLDNRDFVELTLMSMDLMSGAQEVIPLKIKDPDASDEWQFDPIYEILTPIDLYSEYRGTAGIYDIGSDMIYYASMQARANETNDGVAVRITVLTVDPGTGETSVSGIFDLPLEYDTIVYSNVRINAASKRLVYYDSGSLTCYDFTGQEIWSCEALGYEPLGFDLSDDGSLLVLEKTGSEALLHVLSAKDGGETAVSDLGSPVLLSREKVSCQVLSDEERMIVIGDDAYLVDAKTWELRTAITDNYITCNPDQRQFMIGNADKLEIGHAPYRTMEEMIAEARETLAE